MMQQQHTTTNGNGTYVHTLSLKADSWFSEYGQALHIEEDLEALMKKHKNLLKNVNSSYLEKTVNYGVISQRVTKLWQILDRLDALWRNPDRTRIAENEEGHRRKLLEEERCKVMQLCMDFQDYKSSRPEIIQSSGERFRPIYYTNVVPGEVISQNQRMKASNDDDFPSSKASSSRTVNTEEALAPESNKEIGVHYQVESPIRTYCYAQDESSVDTDNDSEVAHAVTCLGIIRNRLSCCSTF